MSSSLSSLVWSKNVSDRVWLQLVELWSSMATDVATQLVTHDTLSTLLENEQNISFAPFIQRFYLLSGENFSALLRRKEAIALGTYQVKIVFEREAIIDELMQFGTLHPQKERLISVLQNHVCDRLTTAEDIPAKFTIEVAKLLIEDFELADSSDGVNDREDREREDLSDSLGDRALQCSTTEMDKLLNYQAEQERIFERTKLQIDRDFSLSEIINTTIDQSCRFLGLDRLLIFQLDVGVPTSVKQPEAHKIERVDAVSYEARKNSDITSTLYFQDETCWRESPRCIEQYYQGNSLIVNDLNQDGNLNPCLKSLMNSLQVKAKVATPILVRGQLWGLVIAHQCQPRRWEQKDVRFLRQVAEYVALAILNRYSYEQLQQQKQLLEHQVQVQAQQLKDALIAAEAASKSKHDFLGSMSHELRTPLTCVIGLSSTLLQWSSTKQRIPLSQEKQQEYLHLIQQSGRHLLRLIDNILEFSDVESGKHLLNIKQVSLNEVVRDSIALLRENADDKNITLRSEVNIKPEQDSFLADEVRLKEIMFHILSNSVKFTPSEGDVMVRIWREKHQVVLQIEDTGIGIAESEIPLLFEKFKQIENYRQRVHGGTGLGLALTKKLIELHGGIIEVESALGEGTVFTVYLPEKEPLPVRKKLTAQKISSQTIMLITRDETSATTITQLLNTVEHQVVWLIDSEMALSQIELLQPKIIVIDRDCLTRDVENMIRSIAHNASQRKPNVALLSDRIEHEEWQQYARWGMHEYLLKSMEPSQIVHKIARLLTPLYQADRHPDSFADLPEAN